MPRIYFAKNIKFADSKNAFEELLKVKDFRELTLIEATKSEFRSPTSRSPDVGLQESNSDFDITEFKSESAKIRTSGDGGWLIYSDANLPTWESYIDNQKTDIYTANYLFKSVFVPEGEHEVIFKYPNLWEQDKYSFKNLIFILKQ